jgi:predicted tellurium resistance membrane protein TerC
MWEALFTTNGITALLALTFMEVLLGIDNVIFVSIILGRLQAEKDKKRASLIWMIAGIFMRLILLFTLAKLIESTGNLFPIFGHQVTLKDIITLGGGLFLLVNTTLEIHNKLEGEDPNETIKNQKAVSFKAILSQIVLIDLVFSFDGIITALGMVDKTQVANDNAVLLIRTIAVLIAMFVMFRFAPKISRFIHKHPTFKMLALSFLILISVMLIVEGVHVETVNIPHGYIYFAMAFSFGVELLNMQIRKKNKPVELRQAHLDDTEKDPKALL